MKKITVQLLALSLFFILQSSYARGDYNEIPLYKSDKNNPAHGYISIDHIGFIPTDRLLHVSVFSLTPNTLYDVWIVSRESGERTRAGFEGENSFKTNSGGAGDFKDFTTEFVLGWNKLEISSHQRDGEPSDNIKVILWTWMYQ